MLAIQGKIKPMGTEPAIVINPEVRSGEPIIRGTKTAVADILSLLRDGASRAEILEDFPWLKSGDIDAALDCAGAR
jgi:uncharacterized protein (DUF433 family)